MLIQVASIDNKQGGEEEIEAQAEYLSNTYRKLSIIDVVQRMPFKYFFHAIHHLQADDRLGNPSIEFPIGIAFGDRDFFGSDCGADLILK